MSAIYKQIVALKKEAQEAGKTPAGNSGDSTSISRDQQYDATEQKKQPRRVIGVIGLGATGRGLVQKLLDLGDKVVTYDKRAPGEPGVPHFPFLPNMLKTPGLQIVIDTTPGRKLWRYVPERLYVPLKRWNG